VSGIFVPKFFWKLESKMLGMFFGTQCTTTTAAAIIDKNPYCILTLVFTDRKNVSSNCQRTETVWTGSCRCLGSEFGLATEKARRWYKLRWQGSTTNWWLAAEQRWCQVL